MRLRMGNANRPGDPPIWVMKISTPPLSLRTKPGSRILTSCPSIFPNTAIVGLNASNASKIDVDPRSPACQTSSHCSKCSKTSGSNQPWVSESKPILIIDEAPLYRKSLSSRRLELLVVLAIYHFGSITLQNNEDQHHHRNMEWT